MNTDSFKRQNKYKKYVKFTDAESQAGDAHHRQCESCRVKLAELRAVVSPAGRLQDVPPAQDLWRGV
jgi:hypothetical protein